MSWIDELDFDALHHAYCVHGDISENQRMFLDFLQQQGILVVGNPFVTTQNFETFGIDDARALQYLQQNKAPEGVKKFLIVSALSMTNEAQHALLKMFEEPTTATHFIVLIPRVSGLLPTLISRLYVISSEQQDTIGAIINVQDFLIAPLAERMKIIEQIISEHRKGKERSETGRVFSRHDALEFLNRLEEQLYAEMKKSRQHSREYAQIFPELRRMRELLHNPGSSMKMVLEYIALII